MSPINEIKDFYSRNKERDQIVTTFKEDDIFELLKNVLDFSEHKKVKCVRDLDRWTLYFEKQ